MVKKVVNFNWTSKDKAYFDQIKKTISEPPTLMSLDFEKAFILCTFFSDHSYAVVLTQKRNEGEGYPMAFMSPGLEGAELKYPPLEKQDFHYLKKSNIFCHSSLSLAPK